MKRADIAPTNITAASVSSGATEAFSRRGVKPRHDQYVKGSEAR